MATSPSGSPRRPRCRSRKASPRARPTIVPRTGVSASESGGHLAFVGGTNLQTLVDGLNRVGLKPTDIIAVLQAIKSAGGLQAELVVQ